MNIVVLSGTITREPEHRELGSGSVLTQFDISAPTEAGAATVPIAWFDPPAGGEFGAGEPVVVVGAVRRRFFRAGGATQSRTEVVAHTVLRAGQRRQVTKLLATVAAEIGSG